MSLMTKTHRVVKQLRQQILLGKWEPGQRLPPEDKMVPLLNASRRTVREALLALGGEGLVERRQGSGTYVVDRRKTATVALLCRSEALMSTMSFFYRNLLSSASELIRSAGFRPILEVGHGLAPEEFNASLRLFDYPDADRPLGVISTIHIGSLEKRLEEAGIASVNIGIESPTARHSVLLDYSRMAHLAADLLTRKGYPDFWIMCGDTSDGFAEPQRDPMSRLYLGAAGYDPSRIISVPWSMNCELAAEAFKKVWAGPRRPRAIFFFDDGLADSTLRAILELGIKVPEELALVTEASVGRSFQFPVPVTCIEFDPAEVMTYAWSMLEKLITEQPVEQPTVYVFPRVREGGSL